MLLHKVYCQSAGHYCRSDLFNRQSDVAPKGVLSKRVFVLPERVSSLLERPIQLPKRYASRRCTTAVSLCNAGTRIFIAGAFKWTIGTRLCIVGGCVFIVGATYSTAKVLCLQ
ncbi:hypothetical protein AMTRI_Chr03g55200 [Amborella trichopoda]